MNLDDMHRDFEEHLEHETRDNIERGMTPEAARAAARRKFGNMARVTENTYSVWRWMWLERIAQDFRVALRGLHKNPGFAAVAVLTLAFGIGMNSAVFSVVNAVLVRPLPYPHAERVVWLAEEVPRIHFEAVAQPDFVDWQRQAQSFDKMFAYGYMDSPVVVNGQSEMAGTVTVSEDYWAVSGARPFLGRLPTRADTGAVAVVSYEFYQRHFGNDPNVIGKPLPLNSGAASIIGVLPPGFRFLPPLKLPTVEPHEVDLYIPREPAAMHQSRSGGVSINPVVGRLRPGVVPAQARTELEGIQARLAQAYPGWRMYKDSRVIVTPLQERLVGKSRRALWVLFAAVGLLLLIACVNIANLLLARASTRQKEFSIRAAMGAGRRRMVWQFVAEGIVLGVAGGAAGLLLAHWGVAGLVRINRDAVPRLSETNIDWRVAAFTAAVSLATGCLFAIVPAVSFTRANLHQVLKEGSRGASEGGARLRARSLLATAELAIAVVLLVGAGLLLKGFWRMNAHPPGFDPQRIIVLKLNFSGPAYNPRPAQEAYLKQVLQRVRATPGVDTAGITSTTLRGFVSVIGAPPYPPDQAPQTVYTCTSPGFFQAMGARLVRGRWLADDEPNPAVLINETYARQIFGAADPVGRQIGVPPVNPAPENIAATIAGVVADQKYTNLDVEPGLVVYVPFQQYGFLRRMDLVARISGNAPPLDRVVAQVDPTQFAYDAKTMEQALSDSVAPRRFNLMLLAMFASVALVLALVGIYGVMSYAVRQRTHEIGIRIALGAQRGEVVRMVVRQGMLVAAAGIAAGAAAALGLTRLMASLLYAVTPTDAATFAAVCAILAIAALAACLLPALHAARVDPITALRYE